jgi:hypothetical protein
MAKRRKKSRKYSYQKSSRVVARTTNRRRLRSAFDARINEYNNRFVESRRTYKFHSTPIPTTRPKRTMQKTLAMETGRKIQKPVQQNTYNPLSIPQRAIVCARRKQRKEVMHAIKRAGKSGQKRPTRNQFSHIKC